LIRCGDLNEEKHPSFQDLKESENCPITIKEFYRFRVEIPTDTLIYAIPYNIHFEADNHNINRNNNENQNAPNNIDIPQLSTKRHDPPNNWEEQIIPNNSFINIHTPPHVQAPNGRVSGETHQIHRVNNFWGVGIPFERRSEFPDDDILSNHGLELELDNRDFSCIRIRCRHCRIHISMTDKELRTALSNGNRINENLKTIRKRIHVANSCCRRFNSPGHSVRFSTQTTSTSQSLLFNGIIIIRGVEILLYR